MKFGKYIRNNQLPKWAKYYVDYKFLKHVIKQCLHEAQTPPTKQRTYFNSAARGGSVIIINDKAGPDNNNNSNNDNMEAKLTQYNNHFRSRTDFITAVSDESTKVVEFIKEKKTSLRLMFEAIEAHPDTSSTNALSALHHDIEQLVEFVNLNNDGFRKILKKYDKQLGSIAGTHLNKHLGARFGHETTDIVFLKENVEKFMAKTYGSNDLLKVGEEAEVFCFSDE